MDAALGRMPGAHEKVFTQSVDTTPLEPAQLEFVSEETKELGNETEMAHIERIMREGTGADRQLAVWERTHDLKSVVDLIVEETYAGLKLPTLSRAGCNSKISARR